MQLVIDIDEDTYRYMQSRCKYQNKGDEGLSKFMEAGIAIKNGTPLPKGHGRVIDESKITKCEQVGLIIKDGDTIRCLKTDAPTIVEVDGGAE